MQIYLVALTTFVENTVLFPLNGLGNRGKNHMTIKVRVYFWTLNSISLIYISTLMSVPYHLYYCHFTISFEIRKYESSNPVSLFQIALDIQVTFPYDLKISLSTFAKKKARSLTGIVINLYEFKNNLGNNAILKMLPPSP